MAQQAPVAPVAFMGGGLQNFPPNQAAFAAIAGVQPHMQPYFPPQPTFDGLYDVTDIPYTADQYKLLKEHYPTLDIPPVTRIPFPRLSPVLCQDVASKLYSLQQQKKQEKLLFEQECKAYTEYYSITILGRRHHLSKMSIDMTDERISVWLNEVDTVTIRDLKFATRGPATLLLKRKASEAFADEEMEQAFRHAPLNNAKYDLESYANSHFQHASRLKEALEDPRKAKIIQSRCADVYRRIRGEKETTQEKAARFQRGDFDPKERLERRVFVEGNFPSTTNLRHSHRVRPNKSAVRLNMSLPQSPRLPQIPNLPQPEFEDEDLASESGSDSDKSGCLRPGSEKPGQPVSAVAATTQPTADLDDESTSSSGTSSSESNDSSDFESTEWVSSSSDDEDSVDDSIYPHPYKYNSSYKEAEDNEEGIEVGEDQEAEGGENKENNGEENESQEEEGEIINFRPINSRPSISREAAMPSALHNQLRGFISELKQANKQLNNQHEKEDENEEVEVGDDAANTGVAGLGLGLGIFLGGDLGDEDEEHVETEDVHHVGIEEVE